jgi:hypothetical protein
MANMMNMMSSMMNNKDGMDALQKMMGGGAGKAKKGTRQTYDKNAYKRSMAANKLKSKIDKRREDSTSNE